MNVVDQMGKFNKVARDILILSRNTLLVNLRFLDLALSQFEYHPLNISTLMTDSQNFFYNPRYVLDSYKNEYEEPVRDYLHIVMHCIFRHMYINPTLKQNYWDLACDIAVENVINEIGIKSVSTSREKNQKNYINHLNKNLKFLNAEKIYSFFIDDNIDDDEINRLQSLFLADEHDIWYLREEEKNKIINELKQRGNGNGFSSNANSVENDESSSNVNFVENDESSSKGHSSENGNSEGKELFSDKQGSFSKSEMSKIWKEISERIEMEIEVFSKNQGINTVSLTQNLKAVNREKHNYTSFLKRFAVLGENMQINDDEFDYVFYTYGLNLYKIMPLIEPLEYKEIKKIKEFVIAIDTSGSTAGELVQKFIEKTYNILKESENFFTKINLHIIQCDMEIQEDYKITNQEEFDQYIKNMKIRGLGGTDFKPVFSYVDMLIKNREFENLKGLIYFTDGYGEFPKMKPVYKTAFVYIDDEYNNLEVPPWAIKLVLQKDEI